MGEDGTGVWPHGGDAARRGDTARHRRGYCWGGNSLGQFGVGTRDEQLVPAAMRTTGVLQDARVTLLGTGTETWMVTEPR